MRAPNRIAAFGLIVLMALGSIFLWLAIPVGWLVLASRLTDSSQPSLGPYLVVIIGIPVSMFIVGRLLARLNGTYESVTGQQATVRVQMPWNRSMRGEREDPRPRTVLDVVMVCSVGLALLVFGVWFFFFAGSSLPGA
jgi:multisubunit Na+/H+ antiporter MnhB subunit